MSPVLLAIPRTSSPFALGPVPEPAPAPDPPAALGPRIGGARAVGGPAGRRDRLLSGSLAAPLRPPRAAHPVPDGAPLPLRGAGHHRVDGHVPLPGRRGPGPRRHRDRA